jgi:hypothetical protein
MNPAMRRWCQRKENGARHWLFDNLSFPRTALKTKKPPDLSATAAAKAIRTAKWDTGLLHRCAAVQKFNCSRVQGHRPEHVQNVQAV